MANTGINLPAGFGGLTSFREEYDSKFKLKPSHIILFVVLIVAFRVVLSVFLG